MNFLKDAGSLTFTLPFQLPFDLPFATQNTLSSTTTIAIDKNVFQTLMRLVVIICTYFLFRPHLQRLYYRMSGQEDAAAAEIQERLKKIDNERAGDQSAKTKKVYAVADGGTPNKGTASPAPAASASSRRRKA